MAGDIEVDYKEFEAFAKRIGMAANGQFQHRVQQGVKQAGLLLVGEIKGLTPTGTGTLRRSWSVTKVGHSGDAFTVTIGNSKEYASYVETGHRQKVGRYVPAIGKRLVAPWVEGRFMMRDGVKQGMPAAQKLVDIRVQQALEEVFGGK